MWVILINDDIISFRDSLISSLISEDTIKETFVSMNKSSRTNDIRFALVLSCEKEADKISKHLSSRVENHYHVRKITREEWDSIINYRIESTTNKYKRDMEKIMKDKNEYI